MYIRIRKNVTKLLETVHKSTQQYSLFFLIDTDADFSVTCSTCFQENWSMTPCSDLIFITAIGDSNNIFQLLVQN